MSNVYVSLAGGLGNQLFQVAAGYAYSRKHNKNLVLDCSKWTASQGKNPREYQSTLFKEFKFSSYHEKNVTAIFEKRFNWDELPYYKGHVSLSGYFQSLKYFEEYKDDFLKMLHLPKRENTWIQENNVAVHIRRGDYLQHHHVHLVCGTDYFKSNIEKFPPNYQINVFTDSPEFVKREFDIEFNIIETTSELADLTLMSLHDNIICSNSSFSWWGSLLGKPKKNIIVPKIWFKNDIEHHDIYRNDFTLSKI